MSNISTKKIVWMIAKTVVSVIILMLLFSLIYGTAQKAYDFGFRIFAEDPVAPPPGLTVSVAVVEGKSVMEVGEILQEKGLIRDAKLFYLQELFSNYHGKLQPGIYELSNSMTPEEMMAVMAANAPDEIEGEEEVTVSGNSESSELLDENADTEYVGTEETSDEEMEETFVDEAAE
ncbi:MAG: endolytic transglycosylase MltG [Lachnospiraceae bacterium]|nr:endolytic transglycosylase MltG [Lachnospiraceae bacterium]